MAAYTQPCRAARRGGCRGQPDGARRGRREPLLACSLARGGAAFGPWPPAFWPAPRVGEARRSRGQPDVAGRGRREPLLACSIARGGAAFGPWPPAWERLGAAGASPTSLAAAGESPCWLALSRAGGLPSGPGPPRSGLPPAWERLGAAGGSPTSLAAAGGMPGFPHSYNKTSCFPHEINPVKSAIFL